jgi:hypothetical protein
MFDMLQQDLDAMDADATLAYATTADAAANAAEVAKLQAAAHWADLHAVVVPIGHPVPAPGSRALPGCERLVQLGGAGTPEVAEFCPAELGAVLSMSDHAAGKLIAAALDLRHRLPGLWCRVQAGQVKAWVGRKTAETTRHLSVATCAAVDAEVTPYLDRLSWTRIDAIIQAAWMATDPDAAAATDRTARESLGVWVAPSTEHGTKSLFVRAEAPDLIRFDGTLDRVADSLGLLGDDRSQDERRAAALGWLANPTATLDLFHQAAAAAGVDLEQPEREASTTTRDSRPPATLYVHLTDHTLATGTGVARVEGVGPVTGDRVRDWLSNSTVTVKPVIDLNGQTPVDAYEIPDRLKEAVHLTIPVDCFPFASSTSRTGDLDHTTPYRPPDNEPDEGGPPGQTRLGNLAPMTRRHHRIKTFSHWTVRQVWPGVLAWRSPHGHHYLVDHTGTTRARAA